MNRKNYSTGILILLLIFSALLSGCMGGGTALAEGFDEAALISAAKNMIDKVNENDYDAFMEAANEKFKAAITKEQFEAGIAEYIKAKGEFEAVDKTAVIGQTDKDTKEDFGVVVAVGEYSNGSIQFTISFDKDMKLTGFYLK